jgi:hypothetical protein
MTKYSPAVVRKNLAKSLRELRVKVERTYPIDATTRGLSRENFLTTFVISGMSFGGGSLVLMSKHAMIYNPVISPAFALVALANPIFPRVLLSIIGWTTLPRDDPAATKVMTELRRLLKYCDMSETEGTYSMPAPIPAPIACVKKTL